MWFATAFQHNSPLLLHPILGERPPSTRRVDPVQESVFLQGTPNPLTNLLSVLRHAEETLAESVG
jgi:hypothetical protein